MNTESYSDEDILFVPDGVSEDFALQSGYGFGYITAARVRQQLLPRDERAHKGDYGHALLICGSRGMMGAAVLSVGAALRSGCGLVTAHIPADERFVVSANYPSAMLSLDDSQCFSSLPADIGKYTAIGVGCGLGTDIMTRDALALLLTWCDEHQTRMVIDADAVNILASERRLCELLPGGAILTPHEGELRRLVGEWTGPEHKLQLAAEFARKHNVIMVLKGPNSLVCNRGIGYMSNSSGNAGMAKGGSGDVLTGFLTGLLARGYAPQAAAEIGVYIHGAAGDKARDYYGAESMNSGDLIDFLAEAYAETEEI